MTPKQSLTRKQSLIRRSLVVLSAVLLAAAWAVGISTPASAAQAKALDIVSVTDTDIIGELGPHRVQRPGRSDVSVRVVDNAGRPTTVSEATTIVLEEVSGPGALWRSTKTAVIPRNGSGATIAGATYSQFANGVVLRVRVASGVQLVPDEMTVEVALTAVGANADPEEPMSGYGSGMRRPNRRRCRTAVSFSCRTVPVATSPCQSVHATARRLHGRWSVRTALVVTAIANLKVATGPALQQDLACHPCRRLRQGSLPGDANGVPKLPVIYTLDNTGPLNTDGRTCPRRA